MPTKPDLAEKRRIAHKMQKALNDTHEAIDCAIMQAAALIATSVMLREEAGIPCVGGQAELSTLTEGLAAMVKTRGSYIDVHARIARMGIVNGFITKAEGDLGPKRDLPAKGHLRAVPATAAD